MKTTIKSILVTGGAGFLGSHLCLRLLNQGYDVLCLDNFYTGLKSHLQACIDHPRFELIRHDICYPISLEADAIYHLACPASPVHYQRDPIQTLKTSVLGAINVLELAKRLHVPILLTSTSEIYGDPLIHPQPESYLGNVNPIGPRACYDEGKRCAETLFTDYHRYHGVDIRIARIFNTYGPQMCPFDGRVISNFIMQALSGEPLSIYGNGEQTRSFCYVDDLISGLIKLMERSGLHTPVNLGNANEKNMKDIAHLILQLTNSQSTISYHPLPIDDPKVRCPDLTLAKTQLKWAPTIDLTTGLQKTIHYFREYLKQTA